MNDKAKRRMITENTTAKAHLCGLAGLLMVCECGEDERFEVDSWEEKLAWLCMDSWSCPKCGLEYKGTMHVPLFKYLD